MIQHHIFLIEKCRFDRNSRNTKLAGRTGTVLHFENQQIAGYFSGERRCKVAHYFLRSLPYGFYLDKGEFLYEQSQTSWSGFLETLTVKLLMKSGIFTRVIVKEAANTHERNISGTESSNGETTKTA